MKERPILFSAPMVRALLNGSKTQTRRIAPIRDLNILRHPGDMVTWSVSFLKAIKGVLGSHSGGKASELQARHIIASQFNPYGQPGDRLWVRESLVYCSEYGHYYAATKPGSLGNASGRTYVSMENEQPGKELPARSIPSIFMPRWASRITLEVTAVRVERLKAISYEDALAEGVPDHRPLIESECTQGETADECARRLKWPQREYMNLWNAINGPGSWDANPFVWVVEFKKLEGPTP